MVSASSLSTSESENDVAGIASNNRVRAGGAEYAQALGSVDIRNRGIEDSGSQFGHVHHHSIATL